jgi:two-component system chemotaxis response regulator CheY
MEPLDGIDFTRMVRTAPDSPNPFVPIIMLTAQSSMERVTQARDSGVNEFLAKPVTAKGLYSRIATVIERPRQFVRASEYFGPGRRRSVKEFMGMDRRSDGGDDDA